MPSSRRRTRLSPVPEELDSLEASAQSLADFPRAPWELRLALARQCADEARHAYAYRRHLERAVGYYVRHHPDAPVLASLRTTLGDVLAEQDDRARAARA